MLVGNGSGKTGGRALIYRSKSLTSGMLHLQPTRGSLPVINLLGKGKPTEVDSSLLYLKDDLNPFVAQAGNTAGVWWRQTTQMMAPCGNILCWRSCPKPGLGRMARYASSMGNKKWASAHQQKMTTSSSQANAPCMHDGAFIWILFMYFMM